MIGIVGATRVWVAYLLVAGLLAGACSAAAEDVSLGDPASADGAADGGSTDAFTVRQALSQIPQSAVIFPDEQRQSLEVVMVDVDAAASQAGVTRPADVTNGEQVANFWAPLTGRPANDGTPAAIYTVPAGIFGSGWATDTGAFVEELGFSLGEISTMSALLTSPADFVVVGGVELSTELPEIASGVRTSGEGEDFATGPRTVVSALGSPLRAAQLDDRVALSRATEPVIDWLENDGPTLLDDPVMASIAKRLDEEPVVSAYLITESTTPYLGVGLGWLVRNGEAHSIVVFSYDSAETAAEQRPAVEAGFMGESFATNQPIANLVTVDQIDVRGSEIVVTLRFPDDRSPTTIATMLLRRDGPFGLA